MGGAITTLTNRSVQRFAGICLLLTLLLFAGSVILHRAENNAAARKAVEYRLNVAGQLIEMGIGSEQAAAVVTAKSTPQSIAAGEAVLEGYGYSAGSVIGGEDAYSSHLGSALLAAAGALVCTVIGLAAFCSVFGKVRKLTEQLEHDERIELSDEHDLRMLCEAVAALREKTEHLLEEIKGERQYLADYLSDFSHQIKTPCAGLMLNNDILLSGEMTFEEQCGYLERDKKCLERISLLVTASLKLARLDAGAVVYSFEEVDISLPVAEAVSQLEGIAAENGVRLQNDVIGGATLRCDRLWLCEAVTNLIKNAVEHSHDGMVRIYSESDPMTLRLFIEDNGCGISAEELPLVFRRFWSKSAETDPSSVGIGMSLAKKIAEDMGGKLFIDSEVGKGTKITLEFLC